MSDEKPEAPLRRRIAEIGGITTYGDFVFGERIITEPSREDIQKAIDTKQFENRRYQLDFEELKTEWFANSRCAKDWQTLVRAYHARRVAHFVSNGIDMPIELTSEFKVNDGTHRIKAAIFQGHEFIDVTVLPPPAVQ